MLLSDYKETKVKRCLFDYVGKKINLHLVLLNPTKTRHNHESQHRRVSMKLTGLSACAVATCNITLVLNKYDEKNTQKTS